jgi:hypothetical protein
LSFLDQRRERLSGFLAVPGTDPEGIDLDATFAECFTHYETHWEPVKGARELLTAQRSAGCPVGYSRMAPEACA